MEVVNQIKQAINYMEEHLMEDITYQDAANHIYMSSFHFHRLFRILTGITANEYIRNRRLSLAGTDIASTKESILELALKYQYDTLEGFSKAFTRFHGVSPSKAKEGSVTLRTYHPLQIHISFEGGRSMDYQIKTTEPFYLLAKKKEFFIDAEENLIPSFWDTEIKAGLLEELKKYTEEPNFYGACHQVAPSSNAFDYGIAVKTSEKVQVKGLTTWKVEHPTWAVFECKDVDAIGHVWNVVLKEFLLNSGYSRVDTLDFEYYPHNREGIFCELYIPVEKK